MIESLWLVLGLLLPAAASAAVLLVCTFKGMPEWITRLGFGWSIAVGFAIGYIATLGLPRWPPIESHEWILVAILPAVLAIATLSAFRKSSWWLVGVGRLLFSVGMPILLLQSYLKYEWSVLSMAVWLCGLGLSGFLAWWFLRKLEDGANQICEQVSINSGWWLPGAGSLVAGGTGMTIMLSGSQTIGQLGLTLAAVLTATGIGFVIPRRIKSAQGYVDGAYPILMGLWLVGYFYADLAAWHVITLFLGYQVAWLGEWSPIRSLAPWQNGVLRLVGVTVVTASVVASAALKFSQDASPYS